jgi:glucosyl-3-phosphoglycerate phosphatase
MYLLRHGQSYFNVHYSATGIDPGIEDPELTPLGHQQAAAAARQLANADIAHVIVSPYTRALQTAEPLLGRPPTPSAPARSVRVMHEVRERRVFVCDVGSPPAQLAERFPHHDFSHLPAQWWPVERESERATIARAAAFRETMAANAQSARTVVVAHWAFILALTGRSVENGEVLHYDPRSRPPRRVEFVHP